MKPNVFIPVLVLTAGAAFGLGWVASPESKGETTADAQSKESKSNRKGRPALYRGGSSSAGGAVADFIGSYKSGAEIPADKMTGAIEALRKEDDPILRRKLFTALLEELTPDNALAAYKALREGRRGGRGRGNEDEVRLLANAWGRIDGPGAVAALQEMREAREGEEGGDRRGRGGRGGWDRGGSELVSVLSGWATVDGVGASRYVEGIESDRERNMAAYGIVRGMMVNGVDEAVGYISSMPKGDDGGRTQSYYMSMVASEVLEDGLDAGKEWVKTVSDPSLKSGALSRVAETAIREDLTGAVEWVTQYAGDESADRAFSRVAGEWAEDDPKAVIDWANTLPDNSKAAAYGEAFDEWSRNDVTAAGEYLKTMPPSSARDAAIEEYAENVSRSEPAAAVGWAESIGDEQSRVETLTQVAGSWYRRDKTAATEWLETSGLPAENIQKIQESGDRRGGDFRRGGGRPGGGR